MSKIQLIRPYITFEDVEDDFRAIFSSGTFTKGPRVKSFQDKFSTYTGAKHTFFTTSATTALWACLKLLNIKLGDEVIVSDFSFPATSNVVEDLGATPIFADVSLETFNMLPKILEAKITPKTRAVIFVDALGNPSGLTDIYDICVRHKIPLIEDAACALGSMEHGKKIGSIADLTCFSFHPRKLLCTGEGGAITTDNDDWARWLQIKLNHGADGMQGMGLDFVDYGYNFRLPDLQAAMGEKQLDRLDSIIDERLQTRNNYCTALEPLGFIAQRIATTAKSNFQSVVFRVPDGVDRDALINYLKERDIETSIGTYALSAITFNKKKYDDVQPNAKMLFDTTITLPCYHGVEWLRVVKNIESFLSTRKKLILPFKLCKNVVF